MPRPSSTRARRAAAALAGVVLGVLALSACSTSAPAVQEPTGSAVADTLPTPSETLLPGSDSTHSAVGDLVAGFPTTLVPVPPGAEVLVSSAEPVEGTDLTEVSLNLVTDQSTADLLAAVTAPLVAAGFAAGTPPAAEPGLAAQATFSRGDGSELLVVGILDRDDRRTLTLGGRVRTASP